MFKGNKMLRLGICVLLLSTVFTGCGKACFLVKVQPLKIP